MCCALYLAAGALAGFASFLTTAAIAFKLLGPGGALAETADFVLQWAAANFEFPRDEAGTAVLPLPLVALPYIVNTLGQISGRVLAVEHVLFCLLLSWWAYRQLSALRAWLATRSGKADPQRPKQPLASLQAMQRLADQIRSQAGPKSVLNWETVQAAPAATMDVKQLADGQAASHVDGRGAIYRFKLRGSEGIYVNMYYTKAGAGQGGEVRGSFCMLRNHEYSSNNLTQAGAPPIIPPGNMRSGDLHESNQYDVSRLK
jgi:hypothetical protein